MRASPEIACVREGKWGRLYSAGGFVVPVWVVSLA